MKTFMKFYDALGNSKGQRFRRFFLLLLILAALIGYGFYSKALHFEFIKGVQGEETK